jgi:hypothetical protein
VDEALLRAHEIFLEELSSQSDAELENLLPSLVEAGYVREEPWAEGSRWFLWSFTKAGIKRTEELEASTASK